MQLADGTIIQKAGESVLRVKAGPVVLVVGREVVSCKELINMEQDPKEQALAEWLRTVDKPLKTKEEQKQ